MKTTTYALYLFALFFTPVAFGCIDLWAQMVTALVCFSLVLLLFIQQLRREMPFYKVPGLHFLVFFLVFILLQLIPLPSNWLHFLSPNTYQIYLDALGQNNLPRFLPLSITPELTIKELFHFATCAAIYILTVQLLDDKNKLQQTVHYIILFGLILATLAIIHKFSGSNTVLWLRPAEQGTSPFGPFVYRNHYPGLLEMLLPVTVSLFFYYQPPANYKTPLRTRLAGFFNRAEINRHVLYGFAAFLILGSILLSQSRAGVTCTISGLVILFLWSRTRLKLSGSSRYIIVLFLATLLAGGLVGIQGLDKQFGAIFDEEGSSLSHTGATLNGRLVFWRNALPILSDFPMAGTGLGTFPSIYPSYKSAPSNAALSSAHNDYLELATDGGVIAFLLACCFLFSVFKTTLPLARKRKDRYQIHLFLGSMAGIFALLLHCITEFHFNHSWAVSFYFFVLLGISVSAAHTRRYRSDDKSQTLLPTTTPHFLLKAAWLSSTLFFLTSSLLFYAGESRALLQIPKLFNINPDMTAAELQAEAEKAQSATKVAPYNSRYHFTLAQIHHALKDQDQAQAAFLKAIRLRPTQPEYLLSYGFALSENGQTDAAESFFKAALQRHKHSSAGYEAYGFWLIGRQRLDEAANIFRQHFSIQPSNIEKVIPSLLALGMQDTHIVASLPPTTRAYLAYGQYLVKNQQLDKAEQAFDQALTYAQQEENPQNWFYLNPHYFYKKNKLNDKALAALQQGVAALPADYKLRLAFGDFLAQEDLKHRAKEEYNQALLIKPGDAQAQERLAKLR